MLRCGPESLAATLLVHDCPVYLLKMYGRSNSTARRAQFPIVTVLFGHVSGKCRGQFSPARSFPLAVRRSASEVDELEGCNFVSAHHCRRILRQSPRSVKASTSQGRAPCQSELLMIRSSACPKSPGSFLILARGVTKLVRSKSRAKNPFAQILQSYIHLANH